MAEKRTINIDINSNASEAEKDFKSFNKAVDETTKSAKNLDATFEEVYGELQPLTTRMGEAEDRLYELAIAGDTASKEYQELLTKVGEYRKVQIQTDLAVDGAATTIGQKLGSALTGATSGFAATQGAMALFGSENDALEKSLLKVQSALAIQQGVDGLRTSYKELGGKTGIATKAQAAFNFVMNLNPIILIVTGITLAIAALLKFTSVLDPVIENLKAFGDAIGLTNFKQEEAKQASIDRSLAEQKASIQRLKDIDKEIEAIDRHTEAERKLTSVKLRRIELDKAKAKSTQEVIDLEKEATEEKLALNQTEYDDFIGKQKLTLEAHEEEARLLQGVVDRNIKLGRSDHQNELKLLNERKAFIKKLNNDILNNNFAFYKENQVAREEIEAEGASNVDAIRKESRDKYRAYAQDRLSADRKIEDLKNSLLQDGIEKELEINRDKFRRLQEDTKKNTKLTRKERAALKDLYDKQELAQQKVINQKYIDLEKEKNKKIDEEKAKANQERIDKEDALFQLELDLMKDRQTAEIIALSQSYEAKYLLAQDNAELTKQLEAQFLIDQAAIEDQFRLEKLAKDKEASDKQKDLIESERQARLAAIQKGLEYAQQGADAIQQIGDLVFSNKMAKLEEGSKEEEELARKQFKFNKAMQLGGAIIDAGKAITASLASAPIAIGPVPNPAGIASLAFAATTSAVNIAKIASTKFESTGDPADTPTPNIDESAAPNFNVVGDSGINQIAQLQQQPVQAFVVSGEVTTSQALDRNRVQNATL